MSRDWTPEELQTASKAMKMAGQMGYEDFITAVKEQSAKIQIERFAKRQRKQHFPCPRCGQNRMADDPMRNALSRAVDVQVCDICGTAEAIEASTGEKMCLTEWSIILDPSPYRLTNLCP